MTVKGLLDMNITAFRRQLEARNLIDETVKLDLEINRLTEKQLATPVVE
jgi:hypothetical protein